MSQGMRIIVVIPFFPLFSCMSIEIIHVSYHRPADIRILKPCLIEWFRNPKDLNFTSPKTKYPFSFNHWVQAYYQNTDIQTLVLRSEGWIVGHVSILQYPDKSLGHIFHLFVATSHRNQGNGQKLLVVAEDIIKKEGYSFARLNVSPKNVIAKRLYELANYSQNGETHSGNVIFKKELTVS